MRKPRKGLMVMEKPITAKHRTHFWYIALSAFVLWLFLLYVFNSSAVTVRNDERLIREEDNTNFTVSVRQSDSDSGPVSIPSEENSEENNVTLPVKKQSEDVQAINEIVKELEKDEENDKKDDFPEKIEKKDDFPEKQTRIQSSVKRDRESQRARSRNRTVRKRRNAIKIKSLNNQVENAIPIDPCAGKYVYIHEIAAMFNEELIQNCWTLSRWTDMCKLTSNLGLGPRLPDMDRVSGWFGTNQFTLEVIFHNRMKQYKCLTRNSSAASAVFVPYYPGLDVMRYLWGPFPRMRDAAALDLMKWLRETPEWRRMNGRDHFMVAGRTTWDFMRTPENESDWGNRLMILPEPRNMTMLLIESSPWNYHGIGIPYPTYFHPSNDNEILQWQTHLRNLKRRFLFSFVGAPRPGRGDSIRTELMNQCRASRRKCKLLECVSGSNKCYEPDQIMKFFLSSTFCLQPPGDSYTRRSTFDSILAGCIPVFFHPGSAYAQYIWHLPKDTGSYSVFIPVKDVKQGKVSVDRVLSRIPREKVLEMREEVIKLIPRLMYANPGSTLERFEDAFDVSVKGVLERVERIRKKEDEMFGFPEKFSWKYNLFGNVEKHEWDAYFDER